METKKQKTITNIAIGFSEYPIPKFMHSKSPSEKFDYLNQIARNQKHENGYFKTDLTIEFNEGKPFKFRFDMGDGTTLQYLFDKYIVNWTI